MSKETIQSVGSKFPVMGLLGAVLVVLKALGYISISWWWATAPFWIPLVIVLGILAIIFIITAILFLFGMIFK
ncbi:hypothetical protein N9955_00475 [bacterium]|nr:hypothetical protein [bacterium]